MPLVHREHLATVPRRGTQVSLELAVTPGTAVVRVADRGPGIPSADRERVFDRFYGVDKARTRDRGGSRLGLAVAQSLIAAHGGRASWRAVRGRRCSRSGSRTSGRSR